MDCAVADSSEVFSAGGKQLHGFGPDMALRVNPLEKDYGLAAKAEEHRNAYRQWMRIICTNVLQGD